MIKMQIALCELNKGVITARARKNKSKPAPDANSVADEVFFIAHIYTNYSLGTQLHATQTRCMYLSLHSAQ